MKKFINLAHLLFDLDLQSISNDKRIYWEFNGWLDKFGEKSILLEPKLTHKEKDVNELALLIKSDYDKGEWKEDNEGNLYDYTMRDYYGGFITKKLEEQLSDFTRVGTQTVIDM